MKELAQTILSYINKGKLPTDVVDALQPALNLMTKHCADRCDYSANLTTRQISFRDVLLCEMVLDALQTCYKITTKASYHSSGAKLCTVYYNKWDSMNIKEECYGCCHLRTETYLHAGTEHSYKFCAYEKECAKPQHRTEKAESLLGKWLCHNVGLLESILGDELRYASYMCTRPMGCRKQGLSSILYKNLQQRLIDGLKTNMTFTCLCNQLTPKVC